MSANKAYEYEYNILNNTRKMKKVVYCIICTFGIATKLRNKIDKIKHKQKIKHRILRNRLYLRNQLIHYCTNVYVVDYIYLVYYATQVEG